jgi:hypothetical protein
MKSKKRDENEHRKEIKNKFKEWNEDEYEESEDEYEEENEYEDNNNNNEHIQAIKKQRTGKSFNILNNYLFNYFYLNTYFIL